MSFDLKDALQRIYACDYCDGIRGMSLPFEPDKGHFPVVMHIAIHVATLGKRHSLGAEPIQLCTTCYSELLEKNVHSILARFKEKNKEAANRALVVADYILSRQDPEDYDVTNMKLQSYFITARVFS